MDCYMQINEIKILPHTLEKIKSFKDLNIRHDIIKLPEENIDIFWYKSY